MSDLRTAASEAILEGIIHRLKGSAHPDGVLALARAYALLNPSEASTNSKSAYEDHGLEVI